MKKLILFAMAMALTVLSMPTQANVTYVTYGFKCITNDNPVDAAILEAQMFVDVAPLGSNQVLFTFRNTGPEASAICDVYFKDGSLLGISSLIDRDDGVGGNQGVDFSPGGNPIGLPGGGKIWKVTDAFRADSDPPVAPNGINPDEWLGVVFSLQPGKLFQNVVDDIATARLQIGIHIQAFQPGSESGVNTAVPIPVPGAVLLGSIGVGLVGWLRRRKVL